PVAAAAAAYGDDFNGDGHRDYAEYTYQPDGGGVVITFGTASGPGTETQTVTQASAGVPGAAEADDGFGEHRAAADFNADGYGDLAVSAVHEDVDGNESQGAVTVLWGSASGLSGGTTVPNKAPGSWGGMGQDLATGDFDGDGRQELAVINANQAFVHRGTFAKSGITGTVDTLDRTTFEATALIAGKVDGDARTDLVVIGDVVTDTLIASDAWYFKGGATFTAGKTLRLESISGNSGEADRGGDGLIADFDKDGYGDIAIGTELYDDYRGRVSVWSGSSTGPSTSARITQSTSGIAGTPESWDCFGASLSAGDVNGDGYQDLAVGARAEAIGTVEYAGAVHVLYGGSGGLTGTGSQFFDRDTAGVPGAVEYGDAFGHRVLLRDVTGDGLADLHVAGAASAGVRLLGSASGVTTTSATDVSETVLHGTVQ
ncbi:FG-GAP and VCBS repeat-containing protein, partial [Streptomyces sp. UH6]|uniref:FG-GAP and VCBS repeat-containing protein n=1 Tax=Streptomyces sp. UH6 TaxID=2748379 RepID=UPI0015D46CB7